VAGALVTEQSLEPGADKKFLGSAFIVKADSLEEVRNRMEADVYWTENVVGDFSLHIPHPFTITRFCLFSGTKKEWSLLLSCLLHPIPDGLGIYLTITPAYRVHRLRVRQNKWRGHF
jgi:hypothetical protein